MDNIDFIKEVFTTILNVVSNGIHMRRWIELRESILFHLVVSFSPRKLSVISLVSMGDEADSK